MSRSDVYEYRGERLREALETHLSKAILRDDLFQPEQSGLVLPHRRGVEDHRRDGQQIRRDCHRGPRPISPWISARTSDVLSSLLTKRA